MAGWARSGGIAALLAVVAAESWGADEVGVRWPQFRGPQGSGVAATGTFPTPFGQDTNLWWKVALPSGHSSPVLWGDALFVTGYTEPEFHTLCLDARSGATRWQRQVVAHQVERGSGLSSPAAPTSCTDGQRVFSYFGPFGVVCYDFAGREIWRRPLPEPSTQHGVGSSPVLAGGCVILLRDQDVGSHLLALDQATGEVRWRAERPEFRRGFSTPLVVEEVVVAPGTLRAVAYRARDGQEMWRVAGLPNEMCASAVAGNGLIYCGGWTSGSGVPRMPDFDSLLRAGDQNGDGRLTREEMPQGPGRQHFHYMDADRDDVLTREEYEFIAEVFNRSQNALLAIRPPAGGEAAGTPEVVWSHARGLPYVPTPLLYRDRVYLLKNGGLVTCLNATNGAVLYQEERIGLMGDNYASPVAADGRVVIASQNGGLAVLAAGDELEVLSRQTLGEPILATPAFGHDALYVRSRGWLWAFRETIPGSPTP